jgi:glycosyltransferase involved in cell wall biosynthesis
MKILHVSPCHIDLVTGKNGGVSGYILGLATAQAAAGLNVKVIFPNIDMGKKFECPPVSNSKNLSFECVDGLWGQSSWFKTLNRAIPFCDLVHVHTPYSVRTEYVMAQAARRGVPFLVHSHGKFTSTFRKQKRAFKWVWERLFWNSSVRKSARIIVSGSDEQETCSESGAFDQLSNGFDDSIYQPGVSSNNKKPFFLYLGALEPRKNVGLLIRAFAQISSQEARLLIVGPDTHGLLDELQDLAHQLHCRNRVEFLGAIYGDKKVKLLQQARALVLLSDGEGMANVMMEAIGCRLPMVYSDGCVFSEIARRGGGVQIAPNEPEVAIALNHILSDDKLHSDQVEALGKISHDYAWSGIAARSAYLYEKVLTERQKT